MQVRVGRTAELVELFDVVGRRRKRIQGRVWRCRLLRHHDLCSVACACTTTGKSRGTMVKSLSWMHAHSSHMRRQWPRVGSGVCAVSVSEPLCQLYVRCNAMQCNAEITARRQIGVSSGAECSACRVELAILTCEHGTVGRREPMHDGGLAWR
jgi:hypothetical protein